MAAKIYRILGLMSGSSLDGLDIAYCTIVWEDQAVKSWTLHEAETLPFSDMWKSRLANLPSQSALIFAKTNTYFGHYMAELVHHFVQKYQLKNLDFIASHGHTIFHNPDQRISIQIGDGAALAAHTGIRTICDFRTQDVALDGEGAPLAPLADRYLFEGYDFYLNLGGIANLSARVGPDKWVAFDACPANQILNLLASELGANYDDQGQWARAGTVNPDLLEQVAQFDYYTQAYPKSLGNEWIREHILPLYMEATCSIKDKLATATEHIAIEIAQAIQTVIQKEHFHQEQYKVLVTGGGAFNSYLMEVMQAYCLRQNEVELFLPSEDIVSFKEAILMALLGVLRMEGVPNSLKSITAAKRNTINGAVHEGIKNVLRKS